MTILGMGQTNTRARQSGLRKAMLLAASAAAMTVGAGWSTSASAAAAAADNGSTLDEVVVTANRRVESAQDVPIAVAVISSETIASMGATDTASLSGKVPSLSIARTGSTLYFLRGVGTTGSSANSEASVATYIDGVYLYSIWASIPQLRNVDRIEVLKGPQGTLFGRNTTGGLIQVITKDPLADPALEADVSYGNYKTSDANFYGSTHLNDRVGVGLAVSYHNQDKGFGVNTTRNERVMWNKGLSIQGKIAAELSDTTKVTGLVWHDDQKNSLSIRHVINGYPGIDGVSRNLGYLQFVQADPDDLHYKSTLGYFKIEQDLGFANFVSISAARKVSVLFHLDQDATPIRVLKATQNMPAKNVSQEFQLLSKPDSKLTWLVGAYYFKSKASYAPIALVGSGFAAFGGELDEYRTQKNKSVAGFGQVSYPIMDGTNFTAGARYTKEKSTFANPSNIAPFLAVQPVSTLHEDSVDSNGWTWRLSLDHKFSEGVMGYVSYNRGLKSGGFPLVTTVNLPGYRPEKLDAYEVGMKSQFLDNRARLNVAAFLYKFKDIQVTQTTTGGNAIVNAAAATIKGFDFDFQINVTDHLNVYTSGTYLHGRYDSYKNALWFFPQPNGTVRTFTLDASGKPTLFSPKLSGNLGATWTQPVANGDLKFNAFIQYTDKQFSAPDEFTSFGGYALVNGSIGWQREDKAWGVSVWGRNLLDRKYLNLTNESTVGFVSQPGEPRTFGVTLSTKLY